MDWLHLALLSALLLGLYDVCKKLAVDGNAVLPALWTTSLAGAVVVLAAAAAARWIPGAPTEWSLPRPEARELALLLVKSAIVTLSWVLTFFALKHLPLSLASPVRASAPLFTLLGAVACFGEIPTPRQAAGIATVLVSYFAFSFLGRREGIRFERNPWVWALFAGTVVGAGSGLYDKHLLQRAGIAPMAVQFWFTLFNVALQGALVLVFHRPSRCAARFRWRWSVPAVGLLLLAADQAYFHALAAPGALVSVVSTVRRSNVVVSFALGSLVLREKNRRAKALALAGILAGLALLLS